MSENDFNAMQETLYILSDAKTMADIKEARAHKNNLADKNFWASEKEVLAVLKK